MVKVAEPIPSYIKVPVTDAELRGAAGTQELKLINFWKYQRMADIVQGIMKHQTKVREYKIQEIVPVSYSWVFRRCLSWVLNGSVCWFV